jgi:GT2 family glycosyltransferase
MKLSFVIPSYDRNEELKQCIQSIENAHELFMEVDIEILVVFCGVNNNISDNNSLYFNMKFPELLITQYLRQNIVSRAKNIGIERASGEYIILIDDDAVLKNNFIHILSNTISNHIKVIAAKIQDPKTKECFTKKENAFKRKFLGRLDYNFFRGSALIIEKEVLKRAGMFSEEFGPGGTYHSAEESDLFFRIKIQKEDILFNPDLIVYHPTGGILTDIKAFKYSHATGALLTKYCFDDWRNMPIYLYLIIRIILICSVRICQMILFHRTILLKNKQHRYVSVFKGIINGIFQYIKNRLWYWSSNIAL